MTLPTKIQLYLGPDSHLIEASMKRTGKTISAEIRDRIKKSYEAETIIRNLLGILDTLGGDEVLGLTTVPDIQKAKDYIREAIVPATGSPQNEI